MTSWLVLFGLAYLCGSIPFGVLIGRAKGIDIREHGSRNIGATNVLRVLGRPLGIMCFVLDVLKGAIPTISAGLLNETWGRSIVGADAMSINEQLWWLGVPLAAVLGHTCSIFIGFRGGKGVATGFGGLVALWPMLTLACAAAFVVWYAMLRIFRYVSLASMTAACALPLVFLVLQTIRSDGDVLAVVTQAWPPGVVTLLLATFVVYRHRANIGRIRAGTEPTVGKSPS